MPCLMWFPTDLFLQSRHGWASLPGPPLPRKNDQQTDYQKMRLGSRSHSSLCKYGIGFHRVSLADLLPSLLSLGQLVFMVEFGDREIVLHRPWREIRWEFNRVASGRNFILVCSILFRGWEAHDEEVFTMLSSLSFEGTRGERKGGLPLPLHLLDRNFDL